MSKYAYAIFLKNPFESKPLILFKYQHSYIIRDVRLLLKYKEIIAYDIECVIETFREYSINILPYIIDFPTAIKLITGKPKNEFLDTKEPWTLKNILANHINQKSMNILNKFEKLTMTISEFTKESKDIVDDIMNGFEKSWNIFSKLLIQNN